MIFLFIRTLHTCVLLLLAVFALFSCSGPSKPTLYIFAWSDLFKPELISQFEEEWDCNVIIDTYDSNESMYAKLKLSSINYDLILPSSYYINILQNQKLIQAIDPAKISNLKNYDPQYFKMTPKLMGLPFIISFSGIAYRSDKVNITDPSWNLFSRSDLKGRMTMLNDSREAIGAALKYLGHSVNSRSEEEVNSAGNLLMEWKKNLAKFESEQYKNGLASGEFLLVQGYSIDVIQVIDENPAVAFVYPKEGAIMSIDYMAIPSNSQNVDLAHAFINFMLDTPNALQNVNFTNSLVPIEPIYELLSEKKRHNPILFPPKDALEKMELLEDLQNDTQMYYKVWNRVKSG